MDQTGIGDNNLSNNVSLRKSPCLDSKIMDKLKMSQIFFGGNDTKLNEESVALSEDITIREGWLKKQVCLKLLYREK